MPSGIEDVAARAGVSTATVSRALRGLPNVAEPTRERVLAAARELDYVISPTASRLATGRTRAVGVVTPYIDRWFFGQVVSGVESALRAAGMDLLLYVLPDETVRHRFFEDLPLRRRVDGVLVLTLPLVRAEVDALRALDVPVAFVGASVPGCSSVRIDDVAGARLAVQHLINLGHRRIGMIGGGYEPSAHFTTPDDRRDGYRAALREAGLAVDPALEIEGGYTVGGGEQAMSELLALPDPPTAVFAQSDEMAMGALRALRRAGLECPGDVSVVGFDNHEMAEHLEITTVAQPAAEQGMIAAGLVLDTLDRGAAPVDETVATHLVLRGSTCPPPEVRAARRAARLQDEQDEQDEAALAAQDSAVAAPPRRRADRKGNP